MSEGQIPAVPDHCIPVVPDVREPNPGGAGVPGPGGARHQRAKPLQCRILDSQTLSMPECWILAAHQSTKPRQCRSTGSWRCQTPSSQTPPAPLSPSLPICRRTDNERCRVFPASTDPRIKQRPNLFGESIGESVNVGAIGDVIKSHFSSFIVHEDAHPLGFHPHRQWGEGGGGSCVLIAIPKPYPPISRLR